MAYLEALKNRPKIYIVIISLITIIVTVNELNTFWQFLLKSTYIVQFCLALSFIVAINIAIRWKIWILK